MAVIFKCHDNKTLLKCSITSGAVQNYLLHFIYFFQRMVDKHGPKYELMNYN